MNKIKTNAILNTLAQVLRIITPFITTPYISRVLGVDNVGFFSYSYSLQSYFCLVAVLGTASYGTREIARIRDNRKELSHTFWEIEILRVYTTIAALLGWIVLVVHQTEGTVVYILLSMYIVASIFDLTWLYTGLEMFPRLVARTVVIRILEVVSIFVFVKTDKDLPAYCAIMGLGTLIGNITLWLNLGKVTDSVSLKSLRPFSHLKGTLVFFLPTIATTIYTVLDKTLIGAITKSKYENGIYEQATKVIEIAKAITFTSLNAVLSPRSSYLFVNKKYDEMKSNLKISMDIMLTLGFGFVFGIAGVANWFVPCFFGEGYDGVILLLRLLSPIIVVITISNALGTQYYNPAGLRLKSSIYLLIGAGTNLVLNLLFIPFFKSAGAIVASVLAETVITVLYLVNCDGYLSMKTIIRMAWKKFIAGMVMLGMIILGEKILKYSTLGMIVIIVCSGSMYMLSLMLLKDEPLVMLFNEIKKKLKKKN